jgi:Type II secretion system (T2SS), protein E, N-terminal domain
MNVKRKDSARRAAVSPDYTTALRCSCLPLSTLHSGYAKEQEDEGDEQVVPVSQELAYHVHQALEEYFPRTTPFSLLLLHVSQWEYKQVTQQATVVHVRHRFHAPESFLEQVLTNVRRAIRTDDLLLTHSGTGASLLFPEVDRNGIYSILERIYRNVSLLQAETVLPPLRYETDILIGVGSYPEPGGSLDDLLYHAGLPAHRLTLRPALLSQLWERGTVGGTIGLEIERKPTMSSIAGKQRHGVGPAMQIVQTLIMHDKENAEAMPGKNQVLGHNVPFMQLPAHLPKRLKHLIPHTLAFELRCVPVGRDHQYLTVAMADPTDERAISQLKEATGMAIFPVSCDQDALNELLTEEW